MASLVPADAKYAMLYVYRPAGGVGTLVSYNVHLDDEKICRVHDGDYYAIPVKKEGKVILWTRTEARVELPMEVQFGKAYFVKCGVSMGAFVGHPTLKMMEARTAVRQFKFDKTKTAVVTDVD
jgi:hypothetical protein